MFFFFVFVFGVFFGVLCVSGNCFGVFLILGGMVGYFKCFLSLGLTSLLLGLFGIAYFISKCHIFIIYI